MRIGSVRSGCSRSCWEVTELGYLVLRSILDSLIVELRFSSLSSFLKICLFSSKTQLASSSVGIDFTVQKISKHVVLQVAYREVRTYVVQYFVYCKKYSSIFSKNASQTILVDRYFEMFLDQGPDQLQEESISFGCQLIFLFFTKISDILRFFFDLKRKFVSLQQPLIQSIKESKTKIEGLRTVKQHPFTSSLRLEIDPLIENLLLRLQFLPVLVMHHSGSTFLLRIIGRLINQLIELLVIRIPIRDPVSHFID